MVDITSTNYEIGINRVPEYVPGDVAEQFSKYMARIKEIMSKSSFNETDVNELRNLMTLISKLPGIDGSGTNLENDKNLVFIFFKAIGLEPGKEGAIDPNKLLALKDIPIELPPKSGKFIKLGDAIDLALDPERLKESSRTLGDLLLHFSTWAYEVYDKKIAQLTEQVEIATKILNDLQHLIAMFNQHKVAYPPEFEVDPSKWTKPEDIPAGLRKMLKEKGVGYWKEVPAGSDNWIPDSLSSIKTWALANKSKYIDFVDTYFKAELGITPDLQPGTITDLIKMRDDLNKQLDKLIKAGSKVDEEGSASYTLKKVVDDLNKRFPPDKFKSGENYENNAEAKKAAEEFIMAGQGLERSSDGKSWVKAPTSIKNIFQIINDAVAASQFLSSKLTDDLKIANVNLSTIYGILVDVMKSSNTAINAFARIR